MANKKKRQFCVMSCLCGCVHIRVCVCVCVSACQCLVCVTVLLSLCVFCQCVSVMLIWNVTVLGSDSLVLDRFPALTIFSEQYHDSFF